VRDSVSQVISRNASYDSPSVIFKMTSVILRDSVSQVFLGMPSMTFQLGHFPNDLVSKSQGHSERFCFSSVK
jgi:hypothetical protein